MYWLLDIRLTKQSAIPEMVYEKLRELLETLTRDNQQPSRKEGSTTIQKWSRVQVDSKRKAPLYEDEDIVSSIWKHIAVH